MQRAMRALPVILACAAGAGCVSRGEVRRETDALRERQQMLSVGLESVRRDVARLENGLAIMKAAILREQKRPLDELGVTLARVVREMDDIRQELSHGLDQVAGGMQRDLKTLEKDVRLNASVCAQMREAMEALQARLAAEADLAGRLAAEADLAGRLGAVASRLAAIEARLAAGDAKAAEESSPPSVLDGPVGPEGDAEPAAGEAGASP